MPGVENCRRGSVAILIVMVFCTVLLLLPLGVAGTKFLQDQVLLQRSRQHMQASLGAAKTCLSGELLSVGELGLDVVRTTGLIRERFAGQLPAMLAGRLILKNVSVTWRKVAADPGHWQGSSQPTHLPVVWMTTELTDHLGNRITLRESIELLLD